VTAPKPPLVVVSRVLLARNATAVVKLGTLHGRVQKLLAIPGTAEATMHLVVEARLATRVVASAICRVTAFKDLNATIALGLDISAGIAHSRRGVLATHVARRAIFLAIALVPVQRVFEGEIMHHV